MQPKLEKYKGKGSPHFKDLVGRTFGHWNVLQRAPSSISKKTLFWCKCSCGRIETVHSTHLLQNMSKSCLACAMKANGLKKYFKVGEIPIAFWKKFQSRAWGEKSRGRRRNIKFNLSIEEAWIIYSKQEGRCALSGREIGFRIAKNSKGRWNHTASLDRIDSNGDYEYNNVQWVHKDVNRMKNIYSDQYFIDMCKAIAKHRELK